MFCGGRDEVNDLVLTRSFGSRGRTHVVLVFGHGRHGVLVRAELYVRLPGRLPVGGEVDVDPQRIQGGEELRERERPRERPEAWRRGGGRLRRRSLWRCRPRWRGTEDPSCGQNGHCGGSRGRRQSGPRSRGSPSPTHTRAGGTSSERTDPPSPAETAGGSPDRRYDDFLRETKSRGGFI